MTSISSNAPELEAKLSDFQKFIALGCLHFDYKLQLEVKESEAPWAELIHRDLPEEVKAHVGDEASRLLEARWIRMFLHLNSEVTDSSLVRVYLLPEDWGRKYIDRNSRSLKMSLRSLLLRIDVSPEAWAGHHPISLGGRFDPWASAENLSLFYLFNKLPSPAPAPEKIKNRFSRRAVEDLLESMAFDPTVDPDEPPLPGLKSKLYPYQARSASLMIQREAAPQLQLDPRFDVRQSPNGEAFYFGAKDGSFVKEPKYYEANRGGILAETMGLGKTIICLSVILATKGHLPQIPAAYQTPPRTRSQVGSLKDMAAGILGRHAVPAKVEVERFEAYDDSDLSTMKLALERNTPYYEILPDVPRMNRNTIIPPPRQLALCPGTIVVVPRNLLHQWQSEIRKHLTTDALKILIVDTLPKRAKKNALKVEEEYAMDFVSDLPPPTKLMEYHIVLFTRNRFEQEIQDGADEKGRRFGAGAPRSCSCPYIGASNIPDCSCKGQVYESPMKKVHWLRIIIDEGHNFSSSVSNAVLVAKQLQVERRWIVSGTPAKDLVGVEVDLATRDEGSTDAKLSRELAIEQRKAFSLDDENTKAAKALGTLASHFLMVRPWADSSADGRLEWDDYIYRHEHLHKKTYSGFSACFRRTLEGLVVKTRPEDVERDIMLPSKRHRVVYLKPCWFDKMVQNLFVQVLRANAITSERSDVDYLFHKNSIKARHSLIRNLRQSNFTWTGFSVDDVATTLETSAKYLAKEDKNCSVGDAQSLLESCQAISTLVASDSWRALSQAHEVGLAVEHWPRDSEAIFALSPPEKPSMIGITQLLQGQSHVDSQILLENPSEGLSTVGQVAKVRLAEMQEADAETKTNKEEKITSNGVMHKVGVPSSAVGASPLTSRRASTIATKSSPKKSNVKQEPVTPVKTEQPSIGPNEAVIDATPDRPKSPILPRKRKLTLSDETAELPSDSPLRNTQIIGTTSAKLSYLITQVVQHAATSKILVFYDGDNTAFYLAQALEMLYINHRIYARTLDNATRSAYVALFNSDPDIRVLLIDVACGALGLNLNAANIVLIVNPINRPGIEAQAIKRAHRIGQTKEVLVETLVLEGTMEEQIFKQAKQMSRQQHVEAKELEDDAGIVNIIQNARILPIKKGESEGLAKFAKLEVPQRVFGRPGREKYHHYLGKKEESGKVTKKSKKTRSEKMKKEDAGNRMATPVRPLPEAFTPPPPPQPQPAGFEAGAPAATQGQPLTLSIFGGDRQAD
ncbi:uncharacterized protein N0V89_003974 [Didymosphaeria variabile]|uniref:Helicase C-terminal domain-containing protein n=1 Tax=Didymosphaeria variabile TaxID=1932322 RepID=A0A9W8XPD4_9PLEO|nr:uncharacterized protein N0V89_003974 [Didymosphaeria variabile]KAJ4355949.1 hypothetical protein N0V89_003974 [Didymosphaeria variabile]